MKQERHFSDWINAYMEYTENSEAPYNFRLWTAISTIAAVLERKCYFQWDKTQYCNLYVVLIGPAGVGKGTAMNPAHLILKETKVKLSAESITREALIKDLDKAKQGHLPSGELTNHCSMTIWSEEMTVFMGYNNHDLMTSLINWFDCPDEWEYRTKGAGTNKLKGVWVNFIAGTTPTLLRMSMPVDAFGTGLTSRMIFIYESEKGKEVIFPFKNTQDSEFERQLIADLARIRSYYGEFKFSKDFIDTYSDWYFSNHKSFESRFKGSLLEAYGIRRRMHHIKVAAILNVSRNGDMIITGDDFKRATKIFDVEKNMMKAFQGVGEDPLAMVTAKMVDFLMHKEKTTLGEIFTKFRYDADNNKILLILQSLVTEGAVKHTPHKENKTYDEIEWIYKKKEE